METTTEVLVEEQANQTSDSLKDNIGLYLFSAFFVLSLVAILAFAIVKPS
ncbi:hypothetical protein HBN50_14670 [Halobacteriovorax sp. GB3]|nr:hypothetical protein [Halobacteriovorax sp. GB3]MDD0854353.1 hypothetical protein [Halobacteriovorax sp. GB3]